MAGVGVAPVAEPEVVAAPAALESQPSEPVENIAPPAAKDGKKRRERPPLPPIPDEPIKRLPEPSRTELQEKIDAHDTIVKACFDRLSASRSFYDQRSKIRDAGKSEFDTARKTLADLNEKCRVLFEERKRISANLKDIKEADIAARSASGSSSGHADIPGAGKDGSAALKGIRTIEQLENRIIDLQSTLETSSHSMSEEKKIVAQISFLEYKGRTIIEGRDQSFKDEMVAKETRALSRKELEDKRKAQDTKIDAMKAQVEAQRKIVDGIRAKQDEEINKLASSTTDIDRDEEKKKIGEQKAAIRELRDAFQKELDAWYLNERMHYEQQKIIKRKKWEAQQAEREARRKEWEEEQAQYPEPDPWQSEKDMCTGLTMYLQTILGETVEKPSLMVLRPNKPDVAPTLRSTDAGSTPAREISTVGKAIGKATQADQGGFESLAFSDFVNKRGKGGKGKKGRRVSTAAVDGTEGPAEPADAALKPHSIDFLTAFTKLEITAPNKISEVRAALELVKEKKAYYDTNPDKPTSKPEVSAEKPERKAKKSPSASSNGLLNEDEGASAFPGLVSTDGTPVAAPALDTSRPSFMAITTGAAAVPPPSVPDVIEEEAAVDADVVVEDAAVINVEPTAATPIEG